MWRFPMMFCHAITTAYLAFAFLITRFRFLVTVFSKAQQMNIHKSVNITIRNMCTVQYRKWSPTANDPETANDPQNGPQMILDRKWSPRLTANHPVKTWGMEWILWDWLQKRTDYKKDTFFSRLLKKKGRRTLHLRSIYTRRKKNGINLKRISLLHSRF